MDLAKFEMRALLTALARKVKRLRVEEDERMRNNVLHGFSKLIATVD